MSPVVPYLRDELHLNYTVSSLHFSAWALGGITAGSFGNLFIRKLGCSRAIWVCAAGLCSAVVILLTAKHEIFTISSGVLGGACGSTMGQGVVSIMAERFGPNRSIGITECNICGSLFAFAAPLMMGFFIDHGLTWRSALIVPLLIFFAFWIYARMVFTPYSAAATGGFAGGKLPTRYWFFWFVIWFAVASEWSIIYWTSEFLEKSKHLVRADAIKCISIFLVTMLMGRVIGLKLARTYQLGPLLAVVSMVALGGFLVYWLGPTPMISLVGLGLTGLGMSNIYPLSYSQAIGSAENKAGLAAGRMSISTGTAVLVTPLAMGAIGDRLGIQSSYAVIAILMTLAMILLVVSAVRSKTSDS